MVLYCESHPNCCRPSHNAWLVTLGALNNGSISLNGVGTGPNPALLPYRVKRQVRTRADALAPCIVSVDPESERCERTGNRRCRHLLSSFLTPIHHHPILFSFSFPRDQLILYLVFNSIPLVESPSTPFESSPKHELLVALLLV